MNICLKINKIIALCRRKSHLFLSEALFVFAILIFGFFTKNRHKKAPQIHCGALFKYIVLGFLLLSRIGLRPHLLWRAKIKHNTA